MTCLQIRFRPQQQHRVSCFLDDSTFVHFAVTTASRNCLRFSVVHRPRWESDSYREHCDEQQPYPDQIAHKPVRVLFVKFVGKKGSLEYPSGLRHVDKEAILTWAPRFGRLCDTCHESRSSSTYSSESENVFRVLRTFLLST